MKIRYILIDGTMQIKMTMQICKQQFYMLHFTCTSNVSIYISSIVFFYVQFVKKLTQNKKKLTMKWSGLFRKLKKNLPKVHNNLPSSSMFSC